MPKFIVKTPVTITVCVEVSAKGKKEAIRKADEAMSEISAMFSGCGDDLSRPSMAGVEEGAWFEDLDQNSIFLSAETRIEEKE